MDILKPFKELFNRLVVTPIADYVEQQMDENDHIPKKTPFELQLTACFENCRGREEYSAICVSVVPTTNTGYLYEDPRTGVKVWGFYDVVPVHREKSLSQILDKSNNSDRPVVMMLDLHGAPLEQQIPGWKNGTLKFPNRFIDAPVITVDIPQASGYEKVAVGEIRQAIGRTTDGTVRNMPDYIRGVINGGRTPSP